MFKSASIFFSTKASIGNILEAMFSVGGQYKDLEQTDLLYFRVENGFGFVTE